MLSPILLSLGLEYLSLNPITSEGLARTAINYIEKSNINSVQSKQLLLDSYLSHAYILSNLSWNGKPRTAEAISLAIKAKNLMDGHNNSIDGFFSTNGNDQNNKRMEEMNHFLSTQIMANNDYVQSSIGTNRIKITPLFPSSLAFVISNKFKQVTNHGAQNGNNKNNNKLQHNYDEIINWEDVAAHGQDYNIEFIPIKQGIDQWVVEKYSM